jgi:hypothetical protein
MATKRGRALRTQHFANCLGFLMRVAMKTAAEPPISCEYSNGRLYAE